jgi:non-heme chloroperoxidase
MPLTATKDGTQIFYKDWGPKDAQPIVFHHGRPLSSDDWDTQMLFFLANGYRVVAHDRRGQTLLATHFNGQSLTVEHGAPLRLLVPVKLVLKNVKAITKITYVAEEPRDYWAERGHSRYDGV